MTVTTDQRKKWKAQNRSTGIEWEGAIWADWIVYGDIFSRDYSSSDISAYDLFKLWVEHNLGKYPDDLIPIFWGACCEERGVFHPMPFQYRYSEKSGSKDFLDYQTWPHNPETGEKLNWLTLPVMNLSWNSECDDECGYIQEATHWKPSILQPYVHLPSLASILET